MYDSNMLATHGTLFMLAKPYARKKKKKKKKQKRFMIN